MTTLIINHSEGEPVRRCDSTCHNATTPECICICGGALHGIGSYEASMIVEQYLHPLLESLLEQELNDEQ